MDFTRSKKIEKRQKVWIMVGILFLLSGCQVTPKEDIAVNKNDVGLESKILQSESTVDNDSLKRNSHWEDKWITDVDDISIAVDADVETLGEKYSVVRVLPHDITSDEVKEWADVLFEGNKAYEPETVMTKNEIEESILKFKQKLNNKDELISEYGSEEEADRTISYYEKLIENLEQLYPTAPEQHEQKECDWNFKPYEYYNDGMLGTEDSVLSDNYELNAEAEVNGRKANISATNRNASDYILHYLWFYYDDIPADSEKKTMTKEEAKEVCNGILSKIGNQDQWYLYDISSQEDEDTQIMTLYYTPVYNGVPTVLVKDLYNIKSDDVYAANYFYQSLEISMYNGELNYIYLTSPSDVTEIMNENVQLMDLNTMMNKAKNYMQLKISKASFDEDFSENEKISVEVNNIQLAMFRIKEKNKDSYLMVPAWIFYGNVLDSKNQVIRENEQLLVMNAIDGSSINILLGY